MLRSGRPKQRTGAAEEVVDDGVAALPYAGQRQITGVVPGGVLGEAVADRGKVARADRLDVADHDGLGVGGGHGKLLTEWVTPAEGAEVQVNVSTALPRTPSA